MTYADLCKAWATVLIAVVVALLFATLALSTGAEAQEGVCTGDVVLDPGHGGTDPGAVNNKYNLKEKEQTLDVAMRLKNRLKEDGCTVYMTRTTDKTLTNRDRYTYANTTGADVLVSVHMNGSSNSSTDYTTTLFGKWRKDKKLATTIFESLSTLPAADGSPEEIAKRTPYSFASGVLLKSTMPATIAETVFITNDQEARLLSDSTGNRQEEIAQKLKVGIESYLKTP